jgi:hypothetical protein
MMKEQEFISKDHRYAVVGASRDPKKYGHIVLKDLLDAGFDAVPINPNADSILGKNTYPSIADVEGIDVVVLVVPPDAAKNVLKEMKQKGIRKVWLQPGSESADIINYCLDNDIDCIHGMCIMMQRRKKGVD